MDRLGRAMGIDAVVVVVNVVAVDMISSLCSGSI